MNTPQMIKMQWEILTLDWLLEVLRKSIGQSGRALKDNMSSLCAELEDSLTTLWSLDMSPKGCSLQLVLKWATGTE